jgi:hypothetical protein
MVTLKIIMRQNYPLGRIHPHGSGGKSVYQAAWAAGMAGSSVFLTILGVILILGCAYLAIWSLFVAPQFWLIPVGLAWGTWLGIKGN